MSVSTFDVYGREVSETAPRRKTLMNGYWNVGSTPRTCYYALGMATARVIGNNACVVNRIYAVPVAFADRMTIASISINCISGAAAGANARIGIYRNVSDSAPAPGTLFADLGELDLSTNGVKTISSLTQTIEPNHCWWFAYHSESTQTIRVLNYATAGCYIIGGFNVTLPTTPGVGWYGSSAYASGLPSTFPALTEMNIDPPLMAVTFA